ncbi:uncharacterized protein LOC133180881 [Saccostrea echinata]|uniref:uncharacterized protein LOC133180881 n=1 Tax=Saccostrea echinata TaxID=191078 RepID=UPI002A839EE5|nr:uncharacterized protein LOC133180881 [Saccostrea echinata]
MGERDENQIDHIAINGKWKRSLQDVRVKRGADVGSDHHLVTAHIKLKLIKVAPKSNIRRINTGKLRENKVRQDFRLELKNRFQVLQCGDVENEEVVDEHWGKICNLFSETSKKTLGFKRQVHKEWITPDTWKKIDKRKDLKTKLCNTHSEGIKERLREQYSNCNRGVKKATKKDRKSFIEGMAREAEKAASEQRMGDLYQITKKLSGRKRKTNIPVKDKQGNLIKSEREQDERWRKHFEEVLKCPEPNELAHIQEADIDLEIETEEPSKAEIHKAITTTLKNNKAPGNDQLPAEFFKAVPNLAADILHLLFTKIWNNNTISTTCSSDACFIVKCGVRQGCVMPALLFILAIDWSNAEKIGLKINTKKTEVMSLNTKQPAKIQVDGNNLSNTTTFNYLGSIVTSDGDTDKDIKARLSKARGAFISPKNIWKTNDISRRTKIRIYNSCVLSVLLHGAECWRMTEGDMQTF